MKTARLKEMVPHRDILLENQYNTGIPETSTNTLLQDDKHANVKIKCVCVCVCESSLLSFFCHSISPCRKDVCSKKCVTFDPCSSCSVVLNTLIFDSSVRNSQMGWTGNTICSMLRSSRTICTQTVLFSLMKTSHCFEFGSFHVWVEIMLVVVVFMLLLSVRSAGRSTPVGPAPPQQLELKTSTSGTEDGCSGSTADRKTTKCY